MKHSTIPRILALLLMMLLIIACVILATPVRAAECRLLGKPEPEEWEPDPADVAYISRTIWGEVRGCTELEQRAQAWCILNRVDADGFPDSVAEVVSAPYQFQGYSPSNPAEPFTELAREILILWHAGEREIPADMCFCSGNGRRQTFRNTWLITSETEFYP